MRGAPPSSRFVTAENAQWSCPPSSHFRFLQFFRPPTFSSSVCLDACDAAAFATQVALASVRRWVFQLFDRGKEHAPRGDVGSISPALHVSPGRPDRWALWLSATTFCGQQRWRISISPYQQLYLYMCIALYVACRCMCPHFAERDDEDSFTSVLLNSSCGLNKDLSYSY